MLNNINNIKKELDIFWNNKWLEIIGCGMVDSGFAFGMIIETSNNNDL